MNWRLSRIRRLGKAIARAVTHAELSAEIEADRVLSPEALEQEPNYGADSRFELDVTPSDPPPELDKQERGRERSAVYRTTGDLT